MEWECAILDLSEKIHAPAAWIVVCAVTGWQRQNNNKQCMHDDYTLDRGQRR